MQPCDRGGERKAQPRSGQRARTVEPHEALQSSFAIFGRDARPAIRNRDFEPVAIAPRRDADFAVRPRGSVLERVVDHVAERLRQQFAIAGHFESRLDRRGQSRALFFGHRFVEFDDVGDDLVNLDRRHRAAGLSRLGAGDHQQRVEDADEIFRVLDHRAERRALFFRRRAVARRRFGAVAQPRQRRAQIMSDIVGHFAQAAHQLADPRQHGVEIFGEPVEFVAGAGDGEAFVEPAGHDSPRRRGQIVDALQHAMRDEEAAERADECEPEERRAETAM